MATLDPYTSLNHLNPKSNNLNNIYHKQSFQSNISNDLFNYSLEPIISEEDAQLENDVPTVQIIEFDH